MPKKKPKPFRAAKAAKAAARAALGSPPPSLAIPDKRRQKRSGAKHKPSLAKLLADTKAE